MTLSEFRSWLDGFSEAIDGAPNAEQWEKIMAKLATVSGDVHFVPNPLPAAPFDPGKLAWSPPLVGGPLKPLPVTYDNALAQGGGHGFGRIGDSRS